MLANQYGGLIYTGRGDFKKAIPLLEKALKGNERKESIAINKLLGDIYSNLKDYKNAIKYYSGARALDMNMIDVCMKLTQSYMLSGNMDKAFMESSRCAEINPDDNAAVRLKIEVINQKERIDTVKYIISRRKLDSVMQMMYSSLLSTIQRYNSDPSAFQGAKNIELEELKSEMENLMDGYSKLSPPDTYFHVHTITLASISAMIDTAGFLDTFMQSGGEEQMPLLENYLTTLEKHMSNLVAIWDKEKRDPAVQAMIKETEAAEKAAASATVKTPAAATETAKPPARIESKPIAANKTKRRKTK
jgi:tetratricopeptide (TPR) repeat protein